MQKKKKKEMYHFCKYAQKFEYAKRHPRLAAYGAVVLQPFNFIKVCIG